jgi:uncharacterized protein YbaP (TraB family)
MASREKELRMIWEVKKDAKRAFLVGTAHFFPFSFRTSLSRYIEKADTVLFEGPLDQESMAKVVHAGLERGDSPQLFDMLDRQTINRINKALAPGRRARIPWFVFNPLNLREEDLVYEMVRGMKPWLAFFRIWSKFLEKRGWTYSVDLEAYTIAREMGKHIVFLETIEEQITVLEGLSQGKIFKFLKRIAYWDRYSKDYVKCYLAGDLERLRSIAGGFPSRDSSVIDRRDQIFSERMLSHLQKGNAIACVGAPHIRGITRMLQGHGYRIQRKYPP